MSGPQPLLLCLDDLQRVDNTTLDWLAHLGHRIGDRRLLLVGTYRTEEAEAVAELRRSLSWLGSLSEVELTGLDEAALLLGIRNLHGGNSVPGDRAAATRLRAVTGGNPFFSLEMLRALLGLELPMQALSGLEDLVLPATIVEVVERRLGRLSPRTRQVLEAGAILGRTFTFELVQRLGAVTLTQCGVSCGRLFLLSALAAITFSVPRLQARVRWISIRHQEVTVNATQG